MAELKKPEKVENKNESQDKNGNDQPSEKEETGEKEGAEGKKQRLLVLDSLEDVGNWINYLGGFEYLEVAEPITDNDQKVLVQKNSFLRKGSFENLKGRNPSEISPNFSFKYNNVFRNRCKKILSKSLYICLEPKRYHIASLILKGARENISQIGESAFENEELLDLFVSMDQDHEPILPHLGEVALVLTGLVEQFLIREKRDEGVKKSLKMAFTVGLLHDISLKDDTDFLVNDLEKAKESEHEKKSRAFILEHLKGLDPKIARIVSEHHRDRAEWAENKETHISFEDTISECLIFTEYLFMQIRTSYLMKKEDRKNLLEKIFFNVGHSFGLGYFHPNLFEIMAHYQESFQRVMKFGEEIGNLEKKCILKASAVAYPVPLCTQMLCKDKRYDCKLVISSRPINVIHQTKLIGRAEKQIFAGSYPKCRLSEYLPKAPKEISGL